MDELASLRSLGSTLHRSAEFLAAIGSLARDWSAVTGDARYAVLGDTVSAIDRWWLDHDELGGVPTQALDAIAELLQRNLDRIIDDEDAGHATFQARWLQDEVLALLTGPDDWKRRGWVVRRD